MYTRHGAERYLDALEKNASKKYYYACDALFKNAAVNYAFLTDSPFYQFRESSGDFKSSLADNRDLNYKIRKISLLPDFATHHLYKWKVFFGRNKKQIILVIILVLAIIYKIRL